ncbi:MAG: hypothetical protein ACKOHK_11995, partial [Planctomycetia bacterium]
RSGHDLPRRPAGARPGGRSRHRPAAVGDSARRRIRPLPCRRAGAGGVRLPGRHARDPLLTESGLLFFSGGAPMLARLDTGESSPWPPLAAVNGKPAAPFMLPNDPVVPLSYYRGRLVLIERPGDKVHQAFQINFAWHLLGGSYTVLVPAEKQAEKPAEKPVGEAKP